MPGQYLNSNYECVACSVACLECDSLTCLKCQSGYFREADSTGSAKCYKSCQSGYLPSIDSLYLENPSIYDSARDFIDTSASNSLYRAPSAEEADTATSYAIGSQGNHVWDLTLVPFAYDAAKQRFLAYDGDTPVYAQCLPC